MTANGVNLTDPIFHDEDKARAHFEACRWPDGPVCPHCGAVNEATLVQGKSHRAGMYQCNACREPFTVKVGTVMEASHIPYTKWAIAFHLMAASKKGVSAHQLHRMLGISYKTAWFLEHRVREAMRDAVPSPLGGNGTIVEADEVYVGGKPRKGTDGQRTKKDRKVPVAVLVERGKGGRVKAKPVSHPIAGELLRNIAASVVPGTEMHTDEHKAYQRIPKAIGGLHLTVNHVAGEYAREGIHNNTAESWNALLKRSIVGSFHHVSREHLSRYCDEVAFRWNLRTVNDTIRAEEAIKGAGGKRLTYKQPRSAQ
ncbi:MAG TPA: IS1595 family transposase [Stellaceae bacterium]|nr:IS1595 family transposase [Stellaceae bacterium]